MTPDPGGTAGRKGGGESASVGVWGEGGGEAWQASCLRISDPHWRYLCWPGPPVTSNWDPLPIAMGRFLVREGGGRVEGGLDTADFLN